MIWISLIMRQPSFAHASLLAGSAALLLSSSCLLALAPFASSQSATAINLTGANMLQYGRYSEQFYSASEGFARYQLGVRMAL